MVENNEAFVNSVRKLGKDFEIAFARGMGGIVEEVEKESVKLAPFKTGDLAGNVSTSVKRSTETIVGDVQFNVGYAAKQHQDLSLRPGPGTRSKSPTKYGTPGTGYLENAAKGLGKDETMHRILEREANKIK